MRGSRKFCQRGVFWQRFLFHLFFNWRGEGGSKIHYKRAIIGASLAYWWWPNIGCLLGSFVVFRGSGQILLRNPIFLWFFSGVGSGPPAPLWIRACMRNIKIQRAWGTHYISVGRDVLNKGASFSYRIWNGSVSSLNSGRGFKQTCLERSSWLSAEELMPVWWEKSHRQGLRKADYDSYEAKRWAYIVVVGLLVFMGAGGSNYFIWKGASLVSGKGLGSYRRVPIHSIGSTLTSSPW